MILGASARAAAQSACRAGLAPVAGDLFADEDLHACCPVVQCDDYPNGLEAIARAAPPGPWMAIGGLENYPDLVDRISQKRPLLGNLGDVLRRVRDPFQLAAAFDEAGIANPAVERDATRIPVDGSWLQKPLAGCGGAGIRSWTGAHTSDDMLDRCYFQERIEGESISAVYLAAAGKAQLLGATSQLSGTPWTGAGRFQYAGSIGPLPTNPDLQRQLLQLGSRLAQAFGLIGLFGVDAILAGNTAWPVEVNPRLPASAEILERSLGLNAIACHMDACQNGNIKISEIQSDFSPPNEGPRSHGKAILYAACDTIIDDRLLDRIREKNSGLVDPAIADIPTPGTHVLAGQPLFTIFAAGPNRQIVEQRLQSLAAEFLTAPAA